MPDNTIPRKVGKQGNAAERAVVDGGTWGIFVDNGQNVVLSDMSRTNHWPLERVSFSPGAFGYDTEGISKLPRLWRFQGKVPLEVGDAYWIEFLHGNPRLPMVCAGVRSPVPEDLDFFPRIERGHDANRWAARLEFRDATGVRTGHLQIRALDGGKTFELVVGGPTFGTGVRVLLDYDTGQIKLGKGAEVHPAGFGDEIVRRLKDLANDILAVNAAHAGAGTAPVALPLLNSPLVVTDVDTSLAMGAPLLSSTVKVE